MEIIVQTNAEPGLVLEALASLATEDMTSLRIAVAYTTLGGSELLVPELSRRLGANAWTRLPKTLVTSLDYGCTDADALVYWAQQPLATVRVANAHLLARRTLLPVHAFHPKLYVFDRGAAQSLAIGSANMTIRAFTNNTEVMSVERTPAILFPASDWDSILAGTQPLDDALVAAYRAARPACRAPETDDPPPQIPLNAVGLPVFHEEVDAGRLDPGQYARLWVQAGSMSTGGSRNILEVPRYANRFFSFAFNNYAAAHIVIGQPVLTSGRRRWLDRQLAWHGARRMNHMERITLPTINQGGYQYENTCVLFRRQAGGFEMYVAPWASSLAVAWRNASAQTNCVYRLGVGGNRICGLIRQ